MSQTRKRTGEVILALDVETSQQASDILNEVGADLRWVKVGLQSFLREGSDFVRELADEGYEVFLDLKLHDIPNTVAKAIESLSGLPIGMLTIHAAAGTKCLQFASEAMGEHLPSTKLLAVTVLTSMNDQALREVGIEAGSEDQVVRLARLASEAGIQGIVCSPLEIASLRQVLPRETLLVTPGIRPSGSSKDEQQRVLGPFAAVELGADYLVIGRPILKSPDPRRTLREILEEIKGQAQ